MIRYNSQIAKDENPLDAIGKEAKTCGLTNFTSPEEVIRTCNKLSEKSRKRLLESCEKKCPQSKELHPSAPRGQRAGSSLFIDDELSEYRINMFDGCEDYIAKDGCHQQLTTITKED